MTILAVAAILLSVGVPQLNVFFQSNRMVSNTNDLVTALHLARSEAIRRGLRATVCKSAAATTAPNCDGTSWAQGWIVFAKAATVPSANANKYEPGNGDILVRAHAAVDGKNVTINQGTIGGYVSFTSRGVPKTTGDAPQSGVFSICDARGTSVAHGVELNAAGSIRSTTDVTKLTCP
jgi:type IV fimbrial biogenesis protein FimT